MVFFGDQACPDVLFGGGCTDSSCLLQHDVRICELCVVLCSPSSNYDSHCKGRVHLASVAANTYQPRSSASTRCPVCSIMVHPDVWNEHLGTEYHRKHLNLAALRAKYEQAEQDKQDVSVSHFEDGVNFGILDVDEANKGVVTEITVSTEASSEVPVLMTEIRSRVENHAPLFTITPIGASSAVARGNPVRYAVRFCHSERGRYEARLEITFEGASQHPFVIARRLLVIVGETTDLELIKPVAPYIRRRRVPWRDDLPVLQGAAPAGPRLKWKRDLLPYPIPMALADVLNYGSPEEVLARLREDYFRSALSLESYKKHFANLLWIEEKRQSEDLCMYDMVDVEFLQEGRLYTLHVHGLAEKRPSVVIGDAIMVQSQDGGETYKGVVHDIRQEAVRINFHSSFQGSGRRFNVRFQLNRVVLRRQHQAVITEAMGPQRLLFPEPGQEGLENPVAEDDFRIALFNSVIGKNAAQLSAVASILHLRTGAAPFIVFGPPGTGKTVTIVEAIQQVLQHDPAARVLACAPSNSAADILALRLITLTQEELFRCNAATREPGSVPPVLAPYTCLRDGRLYGVPSLDTLTKYRVIVSTCINASFAYNSGMPKGHFTHVFIDEAGQASEPEALVAFKPMAGENTRVILSGDPKQLGPVIHSSVARDFGMGVSYLDRLMSLPIYSNAHGRGRTYIKLTQNYRSHGAILKFPNETFYDGELEVCGAPAVINAFLNSPQLVSPRFPVVFHAISGRNEREASSPSYFNVEEAVQVKAIVRSLLQDRRFPIETREIGVIAPYHAQVRKIRRLLHNRSPHMPDMTDVKVGSVEEFQGQERKAIIVSTVRSSTGLLAYDAKFTLGFLANARRFNVAMTRAQSLLVIVGDAAILSVDPIWRAFMNYIYVHDGWRGDAPTWDPHAPVMTDADYVEELREAIATEMNDVIAQLAPGDDMEAEANVDRGMWTNDSDVADWE